MTVSAWQQRQCIEKVAFTTHKEAADAMQAMHRKSRRALASPQRQKAKRRVRLNVYLCEWCGMYHVGHAK